MSAISSERLNRRATKASIDRALRVFRIGMWTLLVLIISLMLKNWSELKERNDWARFSTLGEAGTPLPQSNRSAELDSDLLR